MAHNLFSDLVYVKLKLQVGGTVFYLTSYSVFSSLFYITPNCKGAPEILEISESLGNLRYKATGPKTATSVNSLLFGVLLLSKEE